jgi:pimeloyl-ACP methyl ester carboxylesterase
MHVFSSEESKQKYQAVYLERLALWTIPNESRFVETDYGKTHVIECGNPDGPPLVLLHGFSGTATMWRDIAAELSDDYHIFAVDIIADINLSEPSRKVAKSADFADWLNQTVCRLGIEGCLAMGESYGGWQIMNAVSRHPRLFHKAIVINPMPGLTDFTFAGNLLFMTLALNPSRNNIGRFLGKMVVRKERVEEGFIDLVHTAFRSGKTGIPSDGYVLGDETLKGMTTPILYLVGDSDIFARPETRLSRQGYLNGSSRMMLIPDAGHDMITDEPEPVCGLVREEFPCK